MSKEHIKVALSDTSYTQKEIRGVCVYVGKCLYCNTTLTVEMDGRSTGTIEHILARHHGGTNDLKNLALVCWMCNKSKSKHHDEKKHPDMEYVNKLLIKRMSRWVSNTEPL
jgi:5-methylcytosine-specific restriction endonuclease McrA